MPQTLAALPNGSREIFAASVDILIGYGVTRAQEIANEPTTDPRVRVQLETLLGLPPAQRAGILARLARRTGRHPADDAKPRYSIDEFESRGALSPTTARRGRR